MSNKSINRTTRNKSIFHRSSDGRRYITVSRYKLRALRMLLCEQIVENPNDSEQELEFLGLLPTIDELYDGRGQRGGSARVYLGDGTIPLLMEYLPKLQLIIWPRNSSVRNLISELGSLSPLELLGAVGADS